MNPLIPPVIPTLPPGRAVCDRCRRPAVVCYCAHLPVLPARTHVLVLQHPHERGVGIGTARMAHLALPNSALRVGVDFSGDAVVAATLAGEAPCYLLFPSSHGVPATDLRHISLDRPITLVVVDGTWAQARKLVRVNPVLAALPRIAFTPRKKSEYHVIRREPADFCVSTIEALAEVLNVLEADPSGATAEGFDGLLAPLRAMVDRQTWFAHEVRTNRHHRPDRPRRPSRVLTLASRLTTDWANLVCVQGEANAWPARDPAREEPAIVHFTACRPATGEIFDAVVAPRGALAPRTPEHVDLPLSRLVAGATTEEWHRSWREFSRPDDVLVRWGSFHSNLAAAEGIVFPARHVDLRGELAQAHQRHGTLEECVARLGTEVTSLGIDGRGGRRLAALVSLLRTLCPAPEPATPA